MDRPTFHDYNVCSGQVYTPKEIAEIALRLRNTKKDITLIDKADKRDYSGDNFRLQKEFSIDFTPIEKGLDLTSNWLKGENIDERSFAY